VETATSTCPADDDAAVAAAEAASTASTAAGATSPVARMASSVEYPKKRT